MRPTKSKAVASENAVSQLFSFRPVLLDERSRVLVRVPLRKLESCCAVGALDP
jgi:hypothetical protein